MATAKISHENRTKAQIVKILLTVIIWIGGIIMIIPFVWMLSTSFKGMNDVFNFPIEWIPNPFVTTGYQLLFNGNVPFYQFYLISILVTILTLVGTFFSCTMAGYAYTKINFVGRDQLFLLKLSTTMIPSMVTMLPTFMIYRGLHLVDTLAALWLPGFFGGAFGVFIMRQFFQSLPNELIEAAKIDGASHPGIYFRIALPCSKSAIATLLFMYFVWTWNDYERPLLYMRTQSKFTLPFAVKFFSDAQSSNFPAIMAANVCMLLPIVILFFFCQKYFIQSIVTSGIKG